MSFNKKDYINTIKTMEINAGHIITLPNSDKIEINIVGVKMQKEEKQISLKSIYDLVINLQQNTNNRFDNLEQDIKTINIRLDSIENDVKEIKQDILELQTDVKEIKSLPTIVKEMKQNKLL